MISNLSIATLLFQSMFIGILFLVGFFIVRKGSSVVKFLNGQRILMVTGCYILLLFLAQLFFYTLPNRDFPNKGVSPSDINKAHQDVSNFFVQLSEGKLSENKGVTINGQWNFNYNGNTLELDSADPQYTGSWSIYVERKNSNDNKIEVRNYSTKIILNGIYYTSMIKSPEVILEGNKLHLMKPGTSNIQSVKFIKEFTVRQFTGGEGMFGGVDQMDTVMGMNVLFLRIPKDLQLSVNDKMINITYVNAK